LISGEVNISFSRWLTPDLQSEWCTIKDEIFAIQLGSDQDTVSWKLESNGKFSVKSTYNALTICESGSSFKNIWKGKIPPKIKIFLWLVANDAILTKDNMLKRNWSGDPNCYFCNSPESANHLLFRCLVAKVVWATVATCPCQKKLLPHVWAQITFLLCLNRAGNGVKGGFLLENSSMLLALRQFAGLYGK
jgi:hypothetical protein